MAGYRKHVAAGLLLYAAFIMFVLFARSGIIELQLPRGLLELATGAIPQEPYGLALSLLALIFGSLAPDLDHHASLIRKLVTLASAVLIAFWLILAYSKVQLAKMSNELMLLTVVVLAFALLPRFSSHRGTWHWFFGLLVGIWGIHLLAPSHFLEGSIAYAMGYASHLILDASGIK